VAASATVSPAHFCCPVVSDDEADAHKADSDDDADNALSPDDSLEGEEEEVNADSPRQSVPNPSDIASEDQQERPDVIPFDLDNDNPATNLESRDDTFSALDNSTELLRWHHCLAHLPFPNLRLMAA
jgi:hypothetical protein